MSIRDRCRAVAEDVLGCRVLGDPRRLGELRCELAGRPARVAGEDAHPPGRSGHALELCCRPLRIEHPVEGRDLLGVARTRFVLLAARWRGLQRTNQQLAPQRRQPPGQRPVGVVRLDGRPLGLRDVVIRNVVRLIDGLPILYLLGGVFVLATRGSQRLGAGRDMQWSTRARLEPGAVGALWGYGREDRRVEVAL